MSQSTGAKGWAAVGAIAVVAAHLSGSLRVIERELSPGLAKASWNLVHTEWEPGFNAAKSGLQRAARGGDSDQIAAAATCSYLSTVSGTLPSHDALVTAINQQLAPDEQSLPGVQQGIGYLATRLAGIQQYGRLYTEACFRG